ncbi:uncharacterized protein [Watersipora subatra]|uniref:uncharacterized protein n=1 Tax=Watersipora subatra TaxID=2589382 RepID=UPI00355B032C
MSQQFTYNLGNLPLVWTEDTKYLGVIIQSDLKFDQHIKSKCSKSRKILGGIKHLMYSTPKEAKLLAYTSLCRPILEYADAVWATTNKNTIQCIELVQNDAIRFISNMRERGKSVSEARNQLGIKSLKDRRKSHRLCLLIRTFQNEEKHYSLSEAYDEINQDRENITITTRRASRGELNSVTTNIYHNSFLPRTIRDIRGHTTKTQ